MASEVFETQLTLLGRVPPSVAAETCFALKGRIAINLFIRDLPSLSVDIDLVYRGPQILETPPALEKHPRSCVHQQLRIYRIAVDNHCDCSRIILQ